MWIFEHSVEAKNIKAEDIWNIYQNVADWPSWDSELDSASLIGDFTVGSQVMIKPKKGPKVKAVITECLPYKKFTDTTTLPLNTKLIFSHHIAVYSETIKITHRVTIKGSLTLIFKRVIGKPISMHLPVVMQELIRIAKLGANNNVK